MMRSLKSARATSSWAIAVLVSLCSKTFERGYDRPSRDSHDLRKYEEEPELLFVRKFVIEHALKAFKEAQSNAEPLDLKYSRLLKLSDLFNRMVMGKLNSSSASASSPQHEMLATSQKLLAKIMYEKNFISALTAAIADIDLNYPGAKRVVKYILRPLKVLTECANVFSMHSDSPLPLGVTDDDEIASDSEDSDLNDTREETPDLFRNSALGMLEPGREEDSDSGSEDDDEEMYDDEYGEEVEYGEEMDYEEGIEHDHDEGSQ